MTDRELMQMALDALEAMQSYARAENKGLRICDESIEALRDRLAQPEPEPVAYLWRGELFFPYEYQAIAEEGDDAQPLYTAPPQREWIGLTDEEIDAIQYNSDTEVEYELFDEGDYGTEINIYPKNFARAIEAKLKEKNT